MLGKTFVSPSSELLVHTLVEDIVQTDCILSEHSTQSKMTEDRSLDLKKTRMPHLARVRQAWCFHMQAGAIWLMHAVANIYLLLVCMLCSCIPLSHACSRQRLLLLVLVLLLLLLRQRLRLSHFQRLSSRLQNTQTT